MAHDLQGLFVTGSEASAAALDEAVRDLFAWRGDPLDRLMTANEADPVFVLGRSTTATLLLLGGLRGDDPAVKAAITAAEAHIRAATWREQVHLAAAKAWAAGQSLRAAALWEHILVEYPTDALALRFAGDTYYYFGQSQSIRDSIARVLPAWRPDSPNFGFVLGRYAFGLEETGDLGKAERIARQALQIEPQDAWASHALAHVFEAGAQPREGLEFLETGRGGWRSNCWLAAHLWWHSALYLIELGRGEEALQRYDEFIGSRLKADFFLDLIDAASLLWRLELAGLAVGARWQAVVELWRSRIEDHTLAMNDLHIALALIGARDEGGQDRLLGSLDEFASSRHGDGRDVAADVLRPAVYALMAYGAKDFHQAVELLLPLRAKLARIGGSHAQRDVLNQTLIAAAFGAGHTKLARALLAERVALQPTPRAWQLYAQALDLAGDPFSSAAARQQAAAA